MSRLFLIYIASICWLHAEGQSPIFKTSDPMKLMGAINSSGAEESMPVFTRDSSTLYYVRTYDPRSVGGKNDQDIYFSEKFADLVYSNGENLTELNNKFNNAVLGINVNNNRMYVLNAYKGSKSGTKGIAYSNLGYGFWDRPVPIEIPGLEIKGEHVSMHMTYDEKAAIIAYEGPNSLGKEDMYVSIQTANGWSAPKHLGNVVNSAGFEMSPFLSQDWDTLYFSSNGLGGYGDADIFYSVKQGAWDQWSKPINLGPKINSPKFDAYFIVTPDHLYWSSNRDSELSDIWTAYIYDAPRLGLTISHKVANASKYLGNDGKIDVTISGGFPPYKIKWDTGSKKEDVGGLAKGSYQITVTDTTGTTITERISVGHAPPELQLDLGKLLKLNPIYFDMNSAELREDAKYELDKIVGILNEFPSMKMEIGSHTDCRSSGQFNSALSEGRATSTLQYIQKFISNPKRITAKGYGETKPLSTCSCEGGTENPCTEADHQLNRRSEFIVVGN